MWYNCWTLSLTDPSVHHRQKTVVTDMCYPTEISSLMDFGTPDCSLGKGTAALLEKKKHMVLPWWQQEVCAVIFPGSYKTQSCQLDWEVNTGAKTWECENNQITAFGTWPTRASQFTAGFDLSPLNNVFCHPMLSAKALAADCEAWLTSCQEKNFTLQIALIWMELYWSGLQ